MQAFGKKFLPLDLERSGGRVYLHMTWRKVLKSEDEVTAAAAAPVTKFAIGVEGGFQTDESKWKVEKTNAIVVFPGPTSYAYVACGSVGTLWRRGRLTECSRRAVVASLVGVCSYPGPDVPESLAAVVEAVFAHTDANVEARPRSSSTSPRRGLGYGRCPYLTAVVALLWAGGGVVVAGEDRGDAVL